MSAVITITISAVLLIFPLFTTVYVSVNKNNRTIKVEFLLFGISVYKFNLLAKNFKIYIKKTFKKAYTATITPKFKKPEFLPNLKKISLLSVRSSFNVSIKENFILPFTIVAAINTVENTIFNIVKLNKPYLKLNNEINLIQNGSNFTAYIRLKAVFNLIDVISILINLLSEKIRYAIGKKQN